MLEYIEGKGQIYLKKKYRISYSTMKKICIKHKCWGLNTIKTQNKKAGERRRKVKHNPFLNIEDKNVQYWLGYLAGDGHLEKNNHTITITSKDKELLVKYKLFLNSNVRINSYVDKRFNSTINNVNFCNKETWKHLVNLGITPKKSLTLKINFEITWDFVRGIIDSDGTISNNKLISICSGSEVFINQLKDFFESKFLTPKVYNTKPRLWVIKIQRRQEFLYVLSQIYNKPEYYLNRKLYKSIKMIDKVEFKLTKRLCFKNNIIPPLENCLSNAKLALKETLRATSVKFGEPVEGIPSQALNITNLNI